MLTRVLHKGMFEQVYSFALFCHFRISRNLFSWLLIQFGRVFQFVQLHCLQAQTLNQLDQNISCENLNGCGKPVALSENF